jgi:hypothetical protein
MESEINKQVEILAKFFNKRSIIKMNENLYVSIKQKIPEKIYKNKT